METNYQKSIARAKIKFILGLAIVVSLVNISMLKEQQVLNYHLALVVLATTTGFILDYLVLNRLFKLFELEKIKSLLLMKRKNDQ